MSIYTPLCLLFESMFTYTLAQNCLWDLCIQLYIVYLNPCLHPSLHRTAKFRLLLHLPRAPCHKGRLFSTLQLKKSGISSMRMLRQRYLTTFSFMYYFCANSHRCTALPTVIWWCKGFSKVHINKINTMMVDWRLNLLCIADTVLKKRRRVCFTGNKWGEFDYMHLVR